jgi:hypothetical protein
MASLRCCGRWCFWRLPFGPWCCSRCDRRFDGAMPKSGVARFWEAVDALVAKIPGTTAEHRALLELFRKGGR